MGMVGKKPMVNLTSCGTWNFAQPQDLKVSDLVNVIMSYTVPYRMKDTRLPGILFTNLAQIGQIHVIKY